MIPFHRPDETGETGSDSFGPGVLVIYAHDHDHDQGRTVAVTVEGRTLSSSYDLADRMSVALGSIPEMRDNPIQIIPVPPGTGLKACDVEAMALNGWFREDQAKIETAEAEARAQTADRCPVTGRPMEGLLRYRTTLSDGDNDYVIESLVPISEVVDSPTEVNPFTDGSDE